MLRDKQTTKTILILNRTSYFRVCLFILRQSNVLLNAFTIQKKYITLQKATGIETMKLTEFNIKWSCLKCSKIKFIVKEMTYKKEITPMFTWYFLTVFNTIQYPKATKSTNILEKVDLATSIITISTDKNPLFMFRWLIWKQKSVFIKHSKKLATNTAIKIFWRFITLSEFFFNK